MEQRLLFPYWGKLFYVIKVRSVDKVCLHMSTKQEFIVLVTISQKCDKTKATHNSKLFFDTGL